MHSHAAFLRGMNLGGRRITNAELCGHFTAMGFAQVASFRASGNVVFAAGAEPVEELQARIEAGLAVALDYEVPTFIRRDSEMRAMAEMRPFTSAQTSTLAGKLQVVLLGRAPTATQKTGVLTLASEHDGLSFGARELYWLPAGRMSDSELDLKAIERLLGAITIRTMGTVEQVAAKYFTPEEAE